MPDQAPAIISIPNPIPALDITPTSIAKSTHDDLNGALAAIPDGKHGALLIDGTAKDAFAKPQVRALVVQKIAGNWAVMTSFGWDGHHVEEKIAIGGSW